MPDAMAPDDTTTTSRPSLASAASSSASAPIRSGRRPCPGAEIRPLPTFTTRRLTFGSARRAGAPLSWRLLLIPRRGALPPPRHRGDRKERQPLGARQLLQLTAARLGPGQIGLVGHDHLGAVDELGGKRAELPEDRMA